MVSLLLLVGAGTGWVLYQRLDGNIRTDTDTAAELAEHERERPVARPGPAQNILLLGSDSRAGANSAYGKDEGAARADTTILLHIAGDRRSATAVSLPRDLMVDIPECSNADGSSTPAQFTQFNSAFQYGGAACTIRTVEQLTGVRIDHHAVVDFEGFKGLVDAVDGVEVCLAEPVEDAEAKLELPAGRQTLDGSDALGYVRARHGIGDGSDTDRMARQQLFLGSLVKKVRSNEVLFNPSRLYPLLDAATSSLTADDGLDSLSDLYDLVRKVQSIPASQVRFLTVPRESYGPDPNRDELRQPAADRLFEQLAKDARVRVTTDSTDDQQDGDARESGTPGASATPNTSRLDSPSASPATPSVTSTSPYPYAPSELLASVGESEQRGRPDQSEHPADSAGGAAGNRQGNGGDSAKDSSGSQPDDPVGTPSSPGSTASTEDEKTTTGSEGPSYRGTTAAHDVCSANGAANEAD